MLFKNKTPTSKRTSRAIVLSSFSVALDSNLTSIEENKNSLATKLLTARTQQKIDASSAVSDTEIYKHKSPIRAAKHSRRRKRRVNTRTLASVSQKPLVNELKDIKLDEVFEQVNNADQIQTEKEKRMAAKATEAEANKRRNKILKLSRALYSKLGYGRYFDANHDPWKRSSPLKLPLPSLDRSYRCHPNNKVHQWRTNPEIFIPNETLQSVAGQYKAQLLWRNYCLRPLQPSLKIDDQIDDSYTEYNSTDPRIRKIIDKYNPKIFTPYENALTEISLAEHSKTYLNNQCKLQGHHCLDIGGCRHSGCFVMKDGENYLDWRRTHEYWIERFFNDWEKQLASSGAKLPKENGFENFNDIAKKFPQFQRRRYHCRMSDFRLLDDEAKLYYRKASTKNLIDWNEWHNDTIVLYNNPLENKYQIFEGARRNFDKDIEAKTRFNSLKEIYENILPQVPPSEIIKNLIPIFGQNPKRSGETLQHLQGYVADGKVGGRLPTGATKSRANYYGRVIKFPYAPDAFYECATMPWRVVNDGNAPQMELYQFRETDLDDKKLAAAVKNKLIYQGDRFYRAIAHGQNHTARVIPQYYGSMVWSGGCAQFFEPTHPLYLTTYDEAIEVWKKYFANVLQFHRLTGCALNNIGWRTMGANGKHAGTLKYVTPIGEYLAYPQVTADGRVKTAQATTLRASKSAKGHTFTLVDSSLTRQDKGTTNFTPMAKKALVTPLPIQWQAKGTNEFINMRSSKENDYYGLLIILLQIMSLNSGGPFSLITAGKTAEFKDFRPSEADRSSASAGIELLFYNLCTKMSLASDAWVLKERGLDEQWFATMNNIKPEKKKQIEAEEDQEDDEEDDQEALVNGPSAAFTKSLLKAKGDVNFATTNTNSQFILLPTLTKPEEITRMIRGIIKTPYERNNADTLFDMTPNQKLSWYKLLCTLMYPIRYREKPNELITEIKHLVGGAGYATTAEEEIDCMARLFGRVHSIVPVDNDDSVPDAINSRVSQLIADDESMTDYTTDEIQEAMKMVWATVKNAKPSLVTKHGGDPTYKKTDKVVLHDEMITLEGDGNLNHRYVPLTCEVNYSIPGKPKGKDANSLPERWELPCFMFRSQNGDYTDLDEAGRIRRTGTSTKYPEDEHIRRLEWGSIGYMKDESHESVKDVVDGILNLIGEPNVSVSEAIGNNDSLSMALHEWDRKDVKKNGPGSDEMGTFGGVK